LIGSRTLGKLVEENIYVKNYALELTASHFSETMWSFEQILFMSIEKRLAIFLLDETARRHSDTLKLTHEQIAKYMGSAREVVTRMLRNFSADGILESGRGDIISVHKTDPSGLTDRFPLPAPPRELSMSPGNGKSYLTYNIVVSKDGYYQQNYINAPVFEGITSIQSADMIPLSDNGQTDRYDPHGNIFFETENGNLEGNGGNKNA
jgi:hypothetical protein